MEMHDDIVQFVTRVFLILLGFLFKTTPLHLAFFAGQDQK